MGKSHSPKGRTNLASCIVATIFLISILISAFAVYFTVYKPKDPRLSVSAIQISAFSAANSTVNFTFSQYARVHNPNRAVLAHHGSSLQLLHGGSQVRLMFIPAGKIGPGKTDNITARFPIRGLPVLAFSGQPETTGVDGLGGFRPGEPSMELESRLDMAGRVRILHFFTRHVEAKAECRVAIGVRDGSVLGLHC